MFRLAREGLSRTGSNKGFKKIPFFETSAKNNANSTYKHTIKNGQNTYFRRDATRSLISNSNKRFFTTVVEVNNNNNNNKNIKNNKNHNMPLDRYEIQMQRLTPVESLLRNSLGTLIFPLSLFGLGWYTVHKNYVLVTSRWGKYTECIPEGLHFRNPVALGCDRVFIGLMSRKLPQSKIVDANGNPIVVSAIFNCEIIKPEQYVFNIRSDSNYIDNQAEAVLKRVVSKYPYESRDHKHVSLKNETQEINNEMQIELEKLVSKAGVKINEFYLTDMNYAPEIASQMLIRQQAQAFIEAKSEIATAGVQIVEDTVKQLKAKNLLQTHSADHMSKLVSNLLTVIASGNSVQPTLPLSSSN